jgi:hypothetical protein
MYREAIFFYYRFRFGLASLPRSLLRRATCDESDIKRHKMSLRLTAVVDWTAFVASANDESDQLARADVHTRPRPGSKFNKARLLHPAPQP